MYMAFIINEKDEDLVSFYTKDENGLYKIYYERIERGNTSKLSYYINKYMFQRKKKKNNKFIDTEKKNLVLKKKH